MNEGEVIIDAVIRAAAIDKVVEVPEADACIIVWKANAAEQIEGALREFGYKLIPCDYQD